MNKLNKALIEASSRYLGHREVRTNDSPVIRVWLARCKVRKPAPWCMAFASCMIDDSLIDLGCENPFGMFAGVHSAFDRASDLGILTAAPEYGDIAFHDSGHGQGHVGVILAVNNTETWVAGTKIDSDYSTVSIEGNTGQSGTREGLYVMHQNRDQSYWDLGYMKTSMLLDLCRQNAAKDGKVTT